MLSHHDTRLTPVLKNRLQLVADAKTIAKNLILQLATPSSEAVALSHLLVQTVKILGCLNNPHTLSDEQFQGVVQLRQEVKTSRPALLVPNFPVVPHLNLPTLSDRSIIFALMDNIMRTDFEIMLIAIEQWLPLATETDAQEYVKKIEAQLMLGLTVLNKPNEIINLQTTKLKLIWKYATRSDIRHYFINKIKRDFAKQQADRQRSMLEYIASDQLETITTMLRDDRLNTIKYLNEPLFRNALMKASLAMKQLFRNAWWQVYSRPMPLLTDKRLKKNHKLKSMKPISLLIKELPKNIKIIADKDQAQLVIAKNQPTAVASLKTKLASPRAIKTKPMPTETKWVPAQPDEKIPALAYLRNNHSSVLKLQIVHRNILDQLVSAAFSGKGETIKMEWVLLLDRVNQALAATGLPEEDGDWITQNQTLVDNIALSQADLLQEVQVTSLLLVNNLLEIIRADGDYIATMVDIWLSLSETVREKEYVEKLQTELRKMGELLQAPQILQESDAKRILDLWRCAIRKDIFVFFHKKLNLYLSPSESPATSETREEKHTSLQSMTISSSNSSSSSAQSDASSTAVDSEPTVKSHFAGTMTLFSVPSQQDGEKASEASQNRTTTVSEPESPKVSLK